MGAHPPFPVLQCSVFQKVPPDTLPWATTCGPDTGSKGFVTTILRGGPRNHRAFVHTHVPSLGVATGHLGAPMCVPGLWPTHTLRCPLGRAGQSAPLPLGTQPRPAQAGRAPFWGQEVGTLVGSAVMGWVCVLS